MFSLSVKTVTCFPFLTCLVFLIRSNYPTLALVTFQVSLLPLFQGYPGYPGYPGAMQQADPLFGYFSAVAGPVSLCM